MKKKIIAVFLCGIVVASLVGCGGSSTTTTSETSEESESSDETGSDEEETDKKISDKLTQYVDTESEPEDSEGISDPDEYLTYTNDLIDYIYEYCGYLSNMASFETGQLMHENMEPETALKNALEHVEEDKGVSEDAICTESLNYIYESCQRLEPVPDDEACQEAYDAADYFVGVYASLYHSAIFNMGVFDREACQSSLDSATSLYLTSTSEYKSYIGEEEEEYVFEEYDFGDALDAYQGTWKKPNVDTYLIINGDEINVVREITISDRTTRSVHTFYFGYDEDGNLIVRNESGKTVDSISLTDDGKLIYSDDTYNKQSDDTEVPDEVVDPEVGMTEDEVLSSSWGSPNKKNVTENPYSTTEQWVYDNGYIYFTDGVVTTIQK